MAQYSYNRKYELTIGRLFTDVVTTPNTVVDFDTADDFVTLSGIVPPDVSTVFQPLDMRIQRKIEDIILTQLHFTFSSDNSQIGGGSKGATAELKIYNMSKETRDKVAIEGNRVMLKAGYEGDEELPIIFIGTVTLATTKREGNDVITTLTCSATEKAKRTIYGSFHIPKGSTYEDAFLKCAEIMEANGIGQGEYILHVDGYGESPFRHSPRSAPIPFRGYSFSGKIEKCLDELCKMFKWKYQIINGVLYIYPPIYTDFIQTVNIERENIISAEKQSESINTPATGSKSNDQYIIKTLLLGGVSEVSKVDIKSAPISELVGTWRVQAHSHSLSYEGNEWYTEFVISK